MRVLERLGGVTDDDATSDEQQPREVSFADLFAAYETISDKLVGMLLRARKHGAVDFPGETLWQGQHDGVVIVPLLKARDLEDRLDFGQEFEWGSSLGATSDSQQPSVIEGEEYRNSRMWD